MKNVEFNEEFLEKLKLTSDKAYVGLYKTIANKLNSESLVKNGKSLDLPNTSVYTNARSISYENKVSELKNLLLKACIEDQTVEVVRKGNEIEINNVTPEREKDKDLEQ
ncbi:MAG: hypothetical protein PHO33_01930 [Clostridia bacterium]|nr:hypothetical protein [Clostridia bacterium]